MNVSRKHQKLNYNKHSSNPKEMEISRNSMIYSTPFFIKRSAKQYDRVFNELVKLNITKSTTSLISSIKKEPLERNFEDLYNIKSFLDKSKLIKKLKGESLPQDSLNKITVMCATELRYQQMQPNETLFKIGDIGKDFYLIISGTVDLLKLEPKTELMTGLQYFKTLMQLKKDNENYIFNKVIESNLHHFSIEEKDRKIIHHYAFFILMNEMLQGKISLSIIQIADLCCIDLSSIKRLNIPLLVDFRSLIEGLNIIKEHLNIYDAIKLNKYNFVRKDYDERELTLYEYQSFLHLGPGCYFGDSALDKQVVRNSTIQSIGKTEIAVLDGATYIQTLRKEKLQLTNKEISILHKNFFFESIPQRIFEKKHFNLFIAENLVKGDYICREDQPLTDLFCLIKGEIDLVTNKNIIEIQLLLTSLEDKYKQLKNESNTYSSENNLLDLKKELQEKKLRKVFIYGENEVVGLESFIFSSSYLISAVVASDTASVFKISKKSFTDMLAEFGLLKDTKLIAHDKMKILHSRLYELNKTTISIINKKKSHSKQILNLKPIDKHPIILSNENKENKTFIRINPSLFMNHMPKYKDNFEYNNNSININNTLDKSINLPKVAMSTQQLNQFPTLAYEDSLIRSIKENIMNEKKKFDEMSSNFKTILPLKELPISNKHLRNCFSYNSISNPDLNKKRIEFLIREHEEESNKERTSGYHLLECIHTIDPNQDISEANSNNSITIITSKKKPINYEFHKPLFSKRKYRFSSLTNQQNKSDLKQVNLITRDSENFSSDSFLRGKMVFNCYQKKTIEYQSYKKKIKNRLQNSIKYLFN